MKAEDFEQSDRGPRLFNSWVAKEKVVTPLGGFQVELREPPDDELLRHASELVAFVSNEYDALLTAIYEHYLRYAEDKYWMKSCEVPRNLRDHQVRRYLRGRMITVIRKENGEVHGAISFSPKWEPEHGLHFRVQNGRLMTDDL